MKDLINKVKAIFNKVVVLVNEKVISVAKDKTNPIKAVIATAVIALTIFGVLCYLAPFLITVLVAIVSAIASSISFLSCLVGLCIMIFMTINITFSIANIIMVRFSNRDLNEPLIL